jgi:hypothetical protein
MDWRYKQLDNYDVLQSTADSRSLQGAKAETYK